MTRVKRYGPSNHYPHVRDASRRLTRLSRTARHVDTRTVVSAPLMARAVFGVSFVRLAMA